MSGIDFKAAGYESPSDWARIRDLMPDPENDEQRQVMALAILKRAGIEPGPYTPEAARLRRQMA